MNAHWRTSGLVVAGLTAGILARGALTGNRAALLQLAAVALSAAVLWRYSRWLADREGSIIRLALRVRHNAGLQALARERRPETEILVCPTVPAPTVGRLTLRAQRQIKAGLRESTESGRWGGRERDREARR